jgi:hypothetical protein
MLGLARASEYAGWWSGKPTVSISCATAVSQSVYQTPSFSYNDPGYGAQRNAGGYSYISPTDSSAYGNIDVSGVTALTGYNRYRSTILATFQLNWASGLSNSASYSRLEQKKIIGGSPTFPAFLILSTTSTGALQVAMSNQVTLAGAYSTWIGKWLTCVSTSAESSSFFTAWTGGTPTGSYAIRTCVYNAETGAKVGQLDGWDSGSGFDNSAWITGSGGTIEVSDSGSYAYRVFNNGQDFYGASTQPIRETNVWASFGTAFDPVAIKATDSTWLTTRPNKTIGTAVAWVNSQFTNYENYGGSSEYYAISTQTAVDLYSQTNSRQAQLVASSPATYWTPNYSTTYIPKDQS